MSLPNRPKPIACIDVTVMSFFNNFGVAESIVEEHMKTDDVLPYETLCPQQSDLVAHLDPMLHSIEGHEHDVIEPQEEISHDSHFRVTAALDADFMRMARVDWVTALVIRYVLCG